MNSFCSKGAAAYYRFDNIAGLQAWNEVIERRRHGVIEVQSPEMLRELVRWSGCIGLLMDSTGGQNRNFMPVTGIFRETMDVDVWGGVNPSSPSLTEAQRIMAMLVQGCAG